MNEDEYDFLGGREHKRMFPNGCGNSRCAWTHCALDRTAVSLCRLGIAERVVVVCGVASRCCVPMERSETG